MAGHAQLKFVMTEYSKTQIRLTELNYVRRNEEEHVIMSHHIDLIKHIKF